MTNEEMGRYISARRTALGLTQKQLAGKLHVTDKAVSKWETGRGLPDIQLLEPLAAALEVQPAELLRCGSPAPEETAIREAIRYSARSTREKLFRRAGWAVLALGLVSCGISLPFLLADLERAAMWREAESIIGGADGPTAILVTGGGFPDWLGYLLPPALLVLGALLLLFSRRQKR